MNKRSQWENNEEINYFREYLRIPSVHPNINYEPCVEFLKRQAADLELPLRIFYPYDEKNPIVVLTWTGTQPELPSVVLNSHMDVVPVFEESWAHPPFGAEMDEEGRIFARGAQDMKCVGMQYLSAIRSLKKQGKTFKRTIHLTFVPDEELGGDRGMRPFVLTDDFKNLKAGFSLDEGIAAPDETYPVFYAERSVWRIFFKMSGTTGHGSLLHKNTAGEKLQYIVNKMMGLRAKEVLRLENNPKMKVGDVTTINLTRLNGGVQTNVVPSLLTVGFDVRLAIDVDQIAFEKQLLEWCEEAGGGVSIEYETKRPYVEPTKTDDSNPFWMAFKSAIDELGLKIELQVFPGGTDSRYIRQVGIPALGFSPMNHTPVLLHDNDEFLKAETYLRGVEIYKAIIPKLANA